MPQPPPSDWPLGRCGDELLVMPGAYDALSAESKRTYRKSDALLRVAVPDIESLVPQAKADVVRLPIGGYSARK
mgnify:CR=1 FL=1